MSLGLASMKKKMEYLTMHLLKLKTMRSLLSLWGDKGIVPLELFFFFMLFLKVWCHTCERM